MQNSGIKKIEIPSTLTTIEMWPFFNSSLTDIYVLGLTEAPSGWNSDWNILCNAEVHWNTPMPVESQN